jgi:hypothetical protein
MHFGLMPASQGRRATRDTAGCDAAGGGAATAPHAPRQSPPKPATRRPGTRRAVAWPTYASSIFQGIGNPGAALTPLLPRRWVTLSAASDPSRAAIALACRAHDGQCRSSREGAMSRPSVDCRRHADDMDVDGDQSVSRRDATARSGVCANRRPGVPWRLFGCTCFSRSCGGGRRGVAS